MSSYLIGKSAKPSFIIINSISIILDDPSTGEEDFALNDFMLLCLVLLTISIHVVVILPDFPFFYFNMPICW